jgi:uncharacterized protein
VKYGLSAETIERICSVLGRSPEVEKALLFGSRAKGNYKPGSDIDLALFGPGLTAQTLARINDEFDDLMLPYKIDTLLFAKITHPELIDHIQRLGRLFYEKRATPIGK